jgi:hypothetical protein
VRERELARARERLSAIQIEINEICKRARDRENEKMTEGGKKCYRRTKRRERKRGKTRGGEVKEQKRVGACTKSERESKR